MSSNRQRAAHFFSRKSRNTAHECNCAVDQRHPDWPACTSDAQAFAPALTEAYLMHGVVQGKAVAIGLGRTNEVALGALTDDVVAAAAIERD